MSYIFREIEESVELFKFTKGREPRKIVLTKSDFQLYAEACGIQPGESGIPNRSLQAFQYRHIPVEQGTHVDGIDMS